MNNLKSKFEELLSWFENDKNFAHAMWSLLPTFIAFMIGVLIGANI